MDTCRACNKQIPTCEAVTYHDLCEDCYIGDKQPSEHTYRLVTIEDGRRITHQIPEYLIPSISY